MSLAAAALVLLAQSVAPAPPPPPPPSPPATVGDLAWMAGHWTAQDPGGGSSEELWLAPKAGLMLGLNRGVDGTGGASFEFLRIEQRENGVVYVASPQGGAATDFRLTAWTKTSATFENPAHDFPKRIAYWRDGPTLSAKVDGGPAAARDGFEMSWRLEGR